SEALTDPCRSGMMRRSPWLGQQMRFNRMKRREFITLLAGAAAWPQAARAQRPERRIGILSDFTELQMQPLISAFRQQLWQLGWKYDNMQIDLRVAIASAAQFQAAAATLVGMAPDVIVTLGSPALRAIQQETRTIPLCLLS